MEARKSGMPCFLHWSLLLSTTVLNNKSHHLYILPLCKIPVYPYQHFCILDIPHIEDYPL